MLLIAGLQVPVIGVAFVDDVGNEGILAPLQNGPTGLKVGVTLGVMVIVNCAVVAHCPAVGVKV